MTILVTTLLIRIALGSPTATIPIATGLLKQFVVPGKETLLLFYERVAE
jgi:hypothetical protein